MPSRVLGGYLRERTDRILDDHRHAALNMTLGVTVHKPHPGIVTAAPENEPRALRPPDWGWEGVSQLWVDEIEGTGIGCLGLGYVSPGERAFALAEDVEVTPMDTDMC